MTDKQDNTRRKQPKDTKSLTIYGARLGSSQDAEAPKALGREADNLSEVAK